MGEVRKVTWLPPCGLASTWLEIPIPGALSSRLGLERPRQLSLHHVLRPSQVREQWLHTSSLTGENGRVS